MAKTLADLSLQISTNTAELKKGLDQANSQLNNFNKKNGSVISGIQSGWLKAAGVVGGAVVAFKSVDKIMRSTEEGADFLESSIAGLAGGFEVFSEKLATLDFQNFFNDIIKATKAARDFNLAVDEMGDIERALSIQKSENRVKIAELKVDIAKYKLSDPEKAEEAAEKIISILQTEIEKGIKATNQKMQDLKTKYLDTYEDLSDAQFNMIIDYVKNYDTLTENELKEINNLNKLKGELKEINKLRALNKNDESLKQLANEKNVEITNFKDNMSPSTKEWLKLDPILQKIVGTERDYIKEIIIEGNTRKEESLSFMQSAESMKNKLLGKIEKEKEENEVIDEKKSKLINIKNLTEQIKDVQELQNTATSDELPDLLQKERILQKQLSDFKAQAELDRINNYYGVDAPKLDTELTPVLFSTSSNLKLIEMKENIKGVKEEADNAAISLDKFGDSFNTASQMSNIFANAIADIGTQFGNLFSGMETDFKSVVSSILSGIEQILIGLLAEAIMGLYSNEASKEGVLGLAIATAGVAGLYAVWESLPEFADGGVVYGDTIARVGEYQSVSSNPEVIAPLNKLKSILGESNGINGNVRFEIEGTKLVGVLNKQTIKNNNY